MPREATLEEYVEMLAAMPPEKMMAQNLQGIAAGFGVTLDHLQALIAKQHQKLEDEDTELEVISDPFPDFPVIFGPVHDLATLIGPSLGYPHKVLHLLTTIGLRLSGNVTFQIEDWIQPRYYGIMIGPPSSTKSAVDKESRKVLLPKGTEGPNGLTYPHAPLSTELSVEYSINSGPALVQAFEDSPHHKVLMAPDEISSVFDKGRSTAANPNSLFGELLRLYESNEIGRRVVKSGHKDKTTGKRKNAGDHIQIDDAHLAMIAGGTTKSFEQLWQGTGGAASGLQSRFVLTYSDLMLPAFQTPTEYERAAETLHDLVIVLASAADKLTVSEEAQAQVHEWLAAQGPDLPPRALDMAKRAALVLASCDKTSTVTGGIMRWCLKFATYQIEIKKRLMPEDADGNIQGFENRIIKFVLRHKKASGNQIRQGVKPERYPGGFNAFGQAMGSLTRSGKLTPMGKTRKGQKIYGLD
jgi:hypothetical protein